MFPIDATPALVPLVWSAVALLLLCSLGILVSHDPHDRMHHKS